MTDPFLKFRFEWLQATDPKTVSGLTPVSKDSAQAANGIRLGDHRWYNLCRWHLYIWAPLSKNSVRIRK